MGYKVHSVDDEQLPHDHDWIAVRVGGSVHLAVRASRFSVDTVSEALQGGAALRRLEPAGR